MTPEAREELIAFVEKIQPDEITLCGAGCGKELGYLIDGQHYRVRIAIRVTTVIRQDPFLLCRECDAAEVV